MPNNNNKYDFEVNKEVTKLVAVITLAIVGLIAFLIGNDITVMLSIASSIILVAMNTNIKK